MSLSGETGFWLSELKNEQSTGQIYWNFQFALK